MPHLSCPACGLTTYSAAKHASADRCPRCDALLKGAERVDGGVRRWSLSDLRLQARSEAVKHGPR